MANQLAIARGFKPKPEFHQQLLSGFGSSIAEYDFSDFEQRRTSVERINSLVAEATAGNIEDLLLEEDVDAQTRLVLINAIYYKGELVTKTSQSLHLDLFLFRLLTG